MENMLSKHFRRKEFACKCGCGFDTVDYELIVTLENLRDHFGAPIMIDSGCRCKKRNQQVGGKVKSQHMLGKAADIRVIGIMPKEVAEYLDWIYPHSHGIGDATSFTHIDVREKKARWKYV